MGRVKELYMDIESSASDYLDNYLNDENLTGVLNLYDLNCVLIPTFSSEILKDHEKIKEYFVEVIEIQKGKVKFQPNSFSEQKVGENMYLLSGKYFFHLIFLYLN